MTPPGWGKTMSEAKQTNLKNIPHPALRDEPYAWQAVGGTIWNHKTSEDDRPLYAKPFEWQGLTDEEIHDCFQNRGRGRDGLKTRKMIAAAIEAMLKEKNT